MRLENHPGDQVTPDEEARDRSAMLYDSAPVLCCTIDATGTIHEINRAGATLLERPKRLIVGLPFPSLVQFADAQAFWNHLRRCGSTRTTVTSELRFSVSSGVADFQAITTPGRLPDDSPGYHMVLVDVTLRRHAERATARAHATEQLTRRRLEALNHATSTWCAALTRRTPDLKALLRAICREASGLLDAELAAIGIGTDPAQPFDPWVTFGTPPNAHDLIGRVPRPIGLLGAALPSRGPLRSRDITTHLHFRALPEHHPAVKSFLAVPVIYRGKPRGVLYVANKRDGDGFTTEDEQTLVMFARRAAMTIEIARLRELEARDRVRLKLLARAGHELRHPIDYDETAGAVARIFVPEVAGVCLLYSLTPAGDYRRIGVGAEVTAHLRLLYRERDVVKARHVPAIFREAIQARTPKLVEVSSDTADSVFQNPGHRAMAQTLGVTWLMVVPLTVRDETLAVVLIGTTPAAEATRHLPVIEELSQYAAVALDTAAQFRQARFAVRARDRVLDIVFHDLRSPLTATQMALQLLRRPGNERKTGTYLECIDLATEQMKNLVARLRDAAQIDAGQFAVNPRPSPVQGLIADAVRIMEPQLESAALRLAVDASPSVPAVLGDHGRLLEVISNLVSNAIAVSPRGGVISLEVCAEDDEVRFTVRDHGPGIPARDRPHLFERYWTGKGNPHRGTGLGLYIVQGIVSAHRGRVWVESQPGAGAAFHFAVPAAPAPLATGNSTGTPPT